MEYIFTNLRAFYLVWFFLSNKNDKNKSSDLNRCVCVYFSKFGACVYEYFIYTCMC